MFELDEEHLERNLTGSRAAVRAAQAPRQPLGHLQLRQGDRLLQPVSRAQARLHQLDPGLITELEQDLTNQQFVRMIVDVSHRMGCLVIAEGVGADRPEADAAEHVCGRFAGLFLIARPQELGPEIGQMGSSRRRFQLQQGQNDVVELAIALQPF